MLNIGPFHLRNRVALAPMAGVTDAPFRELAWRFGVGYVVAEMVHARSELWDTAKSRQRRVPAAGVEPFAVQIAGSDPQTMADAARRHWRSGAQVIDINFGCPAKKVCRKAAGSQLLSNEALVLDIVRATVAAVPVPVTVKMRTGYEPQRRNAPALARRMEDEGVAAFAVHGRTRACAFRGNAEHDTVAEVKARVGVPVFANGDICSVAQARAVLAATGVDGVMIGRAALGRPWLLGQLAGALSGPGHPGRQPSLPEKIAVMIEHVRALHAFYGEAGIRIARKHVQWYLSHLTELGPEQPRSLIGKGFNQLLDADGQLAFLASMGGRLAA